MGRKKNLQKWFTEGGPLYLERDGNRYFQALLETNESEALATGPRNLSIAKTFGSFGSTQKVKDHRPRALVFNPASTTDLLGRFSRCVTPPPTHSNSVGLVWCSSISFFFFFLKAPRGMLTHPLIKNNWNKNGI